MVCTCIHVSYNQNSSDEINKTVVVFLHACTPKPAHSPNNRTAHRDFLLGGIASL